MPIGSKNRVIAGCGMHHVALQTRDWEASLRLYREVLGMSVAAEFGTPERKVVLLDMGDGSHMELFQPTEKTPKMGEAAPHDPFTHVALATSDARASIEHIRQAGYKVTVEPRDVALGTLRATIAFFLGPSGETIELFQVL